MDHTDSPNGQANGLSNGVLNGQLNDQPNGLSNGLSNGQPNGHANGHANGHTNGQTTQNGQLNGVDERTDEEILAQLQTFQPANESEKNVWAFWDKGFSKSPPWNQRNVISWVRRLGPSWTVRVLDLVEDSPVNVYKYVDAGFFPEAFNARTMSGKHVAPHTADLVRLPLLYLYGGVWLDVGLMLFRSLDELCWTSLSDPESPFELAGFKITFNPEVSMLFNGFIASRKGTQCVLNWHNTFKKLWEGTTSTAEMSTHPILQHLPKYEPPTRPGQKPPFTYTQFADYLAQVLSLERVRHLQDPSSDWDGPAYFRDKVLLCDCTQEVYWAQRLTMWDGRKQFDLLARQREGVPHDEKYEEAEAFVQGVLDKSSTMKISHGLITPGREYLAELWDDPANHDADNAPGTFAAYLRWAGVHENRPRELPRVTMPPIESAFLTGPVLDALGEPRKD
ncbi:MAG: hypothetical protein M4579_001617 [Chaenotheca gracillima]|nr:MAG: hypothetical protein M4579_001617 [Chaenotheca gracillima]